MKEQIVNNMFQRISYTPYEEVTITNLGSLSKDVLIKEINILFPKIFELNNEVLKIENDSDLQHLIDVNRYQNLENLDDKEIFISYQLLFNYILEIGKVLIKLENTKFSKFKEIIKCLKKLNNIIDLADHQTDIKTKRKLNISSRLTYIQIQNTVWRIEEYAKLLKDLYQTYEGNTKSVYQYCFDITSEAKEIKKSCNVNMSTSKLSAHYYKLDYLLYKLRSRYEKDFKRIEREIMGPEAEEEHTSFGIFSFGKFMMDWAQEIKEQDAKEKSAKLEKQMDNYLLEDWQKELVRKGEYDPWSFEESGDLEEGDYYYEDEQ